MKGSDFVRENDRTQAHCKGKLGLPRAEITLVLKRPDYPMLFPMVFPDSLYRKVSEILQILVHIEKSRALS
jgi:hypothetical protein